MATGTIYNNVVITDRINNALKTMLETRTLMTIDDSLQGADGLTQKIKKYTYTGTAQEVNKGGTATAGSVGYVDNDYTVKRVQAKFVYNDDDALQDSGFVQTGIDGMPKSVVNYGNDKFFGELAKFGFGVDGATFSYDLIVDAIADMDVEDENGLFILGGNDFKKAIRKDPDFKSANQGEILFTGQIGNVAGKPVLISKLVPTGVVYVFTREATKMFLKKDTFVEQGHNIETKDNTITADQYVIIALVDDTKARKVILGSAVASATAFNVVQNAELPTEVEVVLNDGSKVVVPAVYKATYSTATLGLVADTKVTVGGKDIAVAITVVAE